MHSRPRFVTLARMSRKAVVRTLPPLRELFPEFVCFAPSANVTHAVTAMLRDAARRVRHAEETPFYSVRTAQAFFGAPQRTVQRAYQRLAQEGFLRLVRGSQTLVCPRRLRTRTSVHAVVAMPVWLPGFLRFLDLRRFVRTLEEELRRRRLLADLLFYSKGEDERPAFADRLLSRQCDALVWWCPMKLHLDTMLRLQDAGVRLFSLLDPPVDVPGQACLIDWRQGMTRAMAVWKRAGIRIVEVPWSDPARAWSATHATESALRAAGLPYRFPGSDTPIRDLAAQPGTGVIFDNDLEFVRQCELRQREVAALLQRARCLVMREFCLPLNERPPIRVDTLRPDMTRLARLIAETLSTPPAPKARPMVAPAVFQPLVPLEDVAEFGMDE